MDLFTATVDDFSVPADMRERVRKIAEFVRGCSPHELKVIADAQKSRDFDTWSKTARRAQSFAYEQGLRDAWWETVSFMNKEREDVFWSSAWDAAFDYAVAELLRPWSGTTWASKDFDLLVAPLKIVGFSLKR